MTNDKLDNLVFEIWWSILFCLYNIQYDAEYPENEQQLMEVMIYYNFENSYTCQKLESKDTIMVQQRQLRLSMRSAYEIEVAL